MNPFTTNNARLLSDEQLVKTHEASLEILQQVGMEVHNETAREVYARHGCEVDSETLRVRFPPKVIKEAIDSIPPTFTFYARNPDYDRTVPEDGPLVMTASSAPRVLDPVTRQERSATTEDIARIARLVDRLDQVEVGVARSGVVEVGDLALHPQVAGEQRADALADQFGQFGHGQDRQVGVSVHPVTVGLHLSLIHI